MGSFTFVYRMFFVFLSSKNHDHLKKGSFKSMQSFFFAIMGHHVSKAVGSTIPKFHIFHGWFIKASCAASRPLPRGVELPFGDDFLQPIVSTTWYESLHKYIYIYIYIYAYIYMAYRWVIGSKPLTIPGMHIQVYRANCVANSEHGINWFPATCGQE